MQNQWYASRIGLLILVACGLVLATAPAGTADETKSKYVRLVIDFGDGVEKHFTQLQWKDKMTVLDAMQQARQHRRGIRFEHRGKGATLLLTQVDDVKNQGSGGENWIYRVNQKVGDRSIAIYPLKSGDTILWKFETYR